MPSYAITGASRGLGLELVRQLSATRANTVFALVRNPAGAAGLEQLVKSQPPGAVHVLKADVTDPDSLLAAAAAASAVTGGSLDVLVHNAADFDAKSMGLTPSQLPFDHDALWELFRSAMTSNLFGAIWTTNAFLPLLRHGSKKKVIHVTTGMADIDFIKVTQSAQAVTAGVAKAAMNLVTAKYAAELAPEGIRFLAVSPGWVNTAEGPSKSHTPIQEYKYTPIRIPTSPPLHLDLHLEELEAREPRQIYNRRTVANHFGFASYYSPARDGALFRDPPSPV